MGYYTSFSGQLDILPAIEPHHRAYLEKYFDMPHYGYHEDKVATLPDPLREAVGLPVGTDGAFVLAVENPDEHWTTDGITLEPPKVGAREGWLKNMWQPPTGVPNGWCHWQLDPDESALRGPEDSAKFYGYHAWLRYLIQTFFHPWGYKLTGEIYWEGEERDDIGKFDVTDNVVTECRGRIDYVPEHTWEPEDKNEEA